MNRDDNVIGTCAHGNPVHYRYPCVSCEADTLVARIRDELSAGWVPENGLFVRVRALAEQQFTALLARVTPK